MAQAHDGKVSKARWELSRAFNGSFGLHSSGGSSDDSSSSSSRSSRSSDGSSSSDGGSSRSSNSGAAIDLHNHSHSDRGGRFDDVLFEWVGHMGECPGIVDDVAHYVAPSLNTKRQVGCLLNLVCHRCALF